MIKFQILILSMLLSFAAQAKVISAPTQIGIIKVGYVGPENRSMGLNFLLNPDIEKTVLIQVNGSPLAMQNLVAPGSVVSLDADTEFFSKEQFFYLPEDQASLLKKGDIIRILTYKVDSHSGRVVALVEIVK